jgi:hypothetical protein
MALQMDMTLRGFAVKNVYIRIDTITIARVPGGAEVAVGVGYYANAQCLELGMHKSFVFPYTDGMSITQALGYTALKTLPEFAGAIDV